MTRILLSIAIIAGAVASVAGDDKIEPKKAVKPLAADKHSDQELLKALDSDEADERRQAQQELERRGVKNRPDLVKLLKDFDQPIRARLGALGVLQSFWNEDVQNAVIELLQARTPEVRRLAVEALGRSAKKADRDAHEALVQALTERNAAVRSAIFLAIGRLAAPGAADVLVNAVEFGDGHKKDLQEGLVGALESLGKESFTKLLALASSGEKKERDRVVEVFLLMRTRQAAEALPLLLKNYHLSVEQKASLLRAQTDLRGIVREFWIVGPFGNNFAVVHSPEKNATPAATYNDGIKPGATVRWVNQACDPAGRLDLSRIVNQENLSAYALTHVFSPKEQKVEFLTGAPGMARVWLNGGVVHEQLTPPMKPSEEHATAVTLKAGWNRVLARIGPGGGRMRFSLRIVGGDGLRISQTEK